MTISYSLAPIPKWYIANLTGLPLAGGYMAAYSSLNAEQQKLVYQDAGGTLPWPTATIPNTDNKQGILFDENGSQGPFYFEFDTASPDDLYYLEIYDSDGLLQWTINNFSPASSGGGSIITEVINTDNLIINNVFWRNIGTTTSPVPAIVTVIAPGVHAGLAQTATTSGATQGPDILLVKNNLTATDELKFVNFTPLGTNFLSPDVQPVQYLKYTSNAASGETYKYIQIPITAKVQNLANQSVTLTIWARGNSGTTTLALRWRQFFGDGGSPSADVTTTIDTLSLTGSWDKYTINTTVPNVNGKTLGDCGNDALYLQLGLPLDLACDIDLTKPFICLGDIAPTHSYISYDEIDGILNVPRTGAIRTTMSSSADPGWVMMNDGTIGDASSGSTTRANQDTFPLFNYIWNNISNTYAPIFDSSGGVVSRGANAVADFVADRRLSLPKALGRALASSGLASSGATTTWALGQAFGEQDHVLTQNELASHSHTLPGLTGSGNNAAGSAGTTDIGTKNPTTTTGLTGGDAGHNTMQPTMFQNFMIKL